MRFIPRSVSWFIQDCSFDYKFDDTYGSARIQLEVANSQIYVCFLDLELLIFVDSSFAIVTEENFGTKDHSSKHLLWTVFIIDKGVGWILFIQKAS
mgnify:CR=1 FL=1